MECDREAELVGDGVDRQAVEVLVPLRQAAVEDVVNGFIAEASRLVRAESDREQRETGFLLDYRRKDDGNWREADDV